MTRDKDARPERWLPRAEWRVEDVLRNKANGTRPERKEFKAWRQRRLEDAGLTGEDGVLLDDEADGEQDPDDISTEAHLARIQKARRG